MFEVAFFAWILNVYRKADPAGTVPAAVTVIIVEPTRLATVKVISFTPSRPPTWLP